MDQSADPYGDVFFGNTAIMETEIDGDVVMYGAHAGVFLRNPEDETIKFQCPEAL